MSATSAADGDVGGMPHSTESGVGESASLSPPATKGISPGPAPNPVPQGPYRTSDAKDKGSDDGPLESLGKAISSPVEGAVDDEALPDAKPPGQQPPKPVT